MLLHSWKLILNCLIGLARAVYGDLYPSDSVVDVVTDKRGDTYGVHPILYTTQNSTVWRSTAFFDDDSVGMALEILLLRLQEKMAARWGEFDNARMNSNFGL
jgi:hypothetical protein